MIRTLRKDGTYRAMGRPEVAAETPFGETARRVRHELGLTQARQAKRARVHQSTISRLERGELVRGDCRFLKRLALGVLKHYDALCDAIGEIGSWDRLDGKRLTDRGVFKTGGTWFEDGRGVVTRAIDEWWEASRLWAT